MKACTSWLERNSYSSKREALWHGRAWHTMAGFTGAHAYATQFGQIADPARPNLAIVPPHAFQTQMTQCPLDAKNGINGWRVSAPISLSAPRKDRVQRQACRRQQRRR
jgi:hypothetical protein